MLNLKLKYLIIAIITMFITATTAWAEEMIPVSLPGYNEPFNCAVTDDANMPHSGGGDLVPLHIKTQRKCGKTRDAKSGGLQYIDFDTGKKMKVNVCRLHGDLAVGDTTRSFSPEQGFVVYVTRGTVKNGVSCHVAKSFVDGKAFPFVVDRISLVVAVRKTLQGDKNVRYYMTEPQ